MSAFFQDAPPPHAGQAELTRRLARVIQIGTVEEADHAAPRYRVRIGRLLTGWLPQAVARAGADSAWWPLSEGEQVVVVAPSGDLAQGVIVATLYQSAHPAPSDDGDEHRIVYDDGTVVSHTPGNLKASVKGDVSVTATGSITLEADGDIEITAGGNVTINGSRIDLN